jgi:hypothetical protein
VVIDRGTSDNGTAVAARGERTGQRRGHRSGAKDDCLHAAGWNPKSEWDNKKPRSSSAVLT